jgi:hypothetical protein
MKLRHLQMVMLVALCMWGKAAQATLISVDDVVFGADSITQDTASGLEWLDLTQTVGYSYNQVTSRLTTTAFAGWQIATRQQTDAFILDAGPYLGDVAFANSVPGFAPTLGLLTSLLGNTYSHIPSTFGFAGFIADNSGGNQSVLTMYNSAGI